MQWMILPLRRYAEFSGRSRRKEFWMFTLFGFLVGIVCLPIDHFVFGNDWTANGPAGIITSLALFIPNLAVTFRRMHDVDKSAWWYLLIFLPIIGWIWLLVLNCTDGTNGPNRFGADPKNEQGDLYEIFR